MILLFTDFGLSGPYLGQVRAVLWREVPGVPVIDLVADAPPFDPRSGAYLLAALAEAFPPGAVFLAVVDPGVGGTRGALAAKAGGRWFVGPDNGLLSVALSRDPEARVWEITWRPERLSASFHGRDLFALVAGRLARGEPPSGEPRPFAGAGLVGQDWPADLAQVIYVDAFGNAMTGLRASGVERSGVLEVAGQQLGHARTFGDVPAGSAFWYENANGLVEIAVSRGSAAAELNLAPGTPVQFLGPDRP